MSYVRENAKTTMKSPFQKELDSLNLTFAQVEIIKQAIERYVIGDDDKVSVNDDDEAQYEAYEAIDRNNLRYQQRIALRGEPDLSYNRGNRG